MQDNGVAGRLRAVQGDNATGLPGKGSESS